MYEKRPQPAIIHRFYKSDKWRACRKEVLKKFNYKCVLCGKKATTVHHLINITLENVNNPNIALNQDYCIPLCEHCHTELHKKERMKKEGLKNDLL